MENNQWRELGDRLDTHRSTGNVEQDFAAFLALQQDAGTTAATNGFRYQLRWLLPAGLLLVGGLALCGWLLAPSETSAFSLVDPVPVVNNYPTEMVVAKKYPDQEEAIPKGRTSKQQTNDGLKATTKKEDESLRSGHKEADDTHIDATAGNSNATEISTLNSTSELGEEVAPARTLTGPVAALASSEQLLLAGPDRTVPTAKVSRLKKLPSRWQVQLEAGGSLRPRTGITPANAYETFYARTGLTYALSTRLRAGLTVAYNDLQHLFSSENEPLSRVEFSERIPDPVISSGFTTIEANYRTANERMWQLNAEVVYQLLPRVDLEGGIGIGRVTYQQTVTFSGIPPNDPLRSGPHPVLLRRYTPTAHIGIRYAVFWRWSLVARANLAFRDLTPNNAIDRFQSYNTATGYQLGVCFGL